MDVAVEMQARSNLIVRLLIQELVTGKAKASNGCESSSVV